RRPGALLRETGVVTDQHTVGLPTVSAIPSDHDSTRSTRSTRSTVTSSAHLEPTQSAEHPLHQHAIRGGVAVGGGGLVHGDQSALRHVTEQYFGHPEGDREQRGHL